MLLTETYRPKRFVDIVGQSFVVSVLKSVVKAPEISPRSLIFAGPFGTGKTSAALVLAKALNCKDKANVEPCGSCEVCKSTGLNPYWQELDCSDVGNVEAIRGMKSQFFASSVADWRVIIFDEGHLLSTQAQSALLKTLEEAPPKIFFIFATTDFDRLLDTIKSRSVDLHFITVPTEAVQQYVGELAEMEKMDVSGETLMAIARYSRGHMRNAVMLMNLLKLCGNEDVFKDSVRSAYPLIVRFLAFCVIQNHEAAQQLISQICSFPLATVRVDFYEVVYDAVRVFVTREQDSPLWTLVSRMGKKTIDLFKNVVTEWASASFASDLTFQALLWVIFSSMGEKAQPPKTSLLERARKG